MHVVAVEGSAGIASGNDALIVHVVGAFAGMAQGGAVGVQFHLLHDIVVLIAVGATEVVAGDLALLFQHLGHIGQSHNQAIAQSQDEALVALYGSEWDFVRRRWGGGAFDDELLAGRVGDGAEFPQGGAGAVEVGHSGDRGVGETGVEVAETVVGLLAGKEEEGK